MTNGFELRKMVETTAAAEEPGWKKDTSPITFDWYVNETWFENPEGNLAHELIKEKSYSDPEVVSASQLLDVVLNEYHRLMSKKTND